MLIAPYQQYLSTWALLSVLEVCSNINFGIIPLKTVSTPSRNPDCYSSSPVTCTHRLRDFFAKLSHLVWPDIMF